MSNEFAYLFSYACEGLVAGGMTVASAEKLLTDLISESDRIFNAMYEEETVALSEREYDLSREVISLLSNGGTNEGHAILVTAMLMAAVEDRVENGTKFKN